MKYIQTICLAALLLPFVSCSRGDKTPVKSGDIEGWKKLDDKAYEIQYPDSFEVNTLGQMGASFFMTSRPVSKDDMFRENINLMIEDLDGRDVSLDQYVELAEPELKNIPDCDILESKRIAAGGTEYHRIIFTATQEPFELQFEQHYYLVKGKAYILTFTSEMEQFDHYRGIAGKIMESFSIK